MTNCDAKTQALAWVESIGTTAERMLSHNLQIKRNSLEIQNI